MAPFSLYSRLSILRLALAVLCIGLIVIVLIGIPSFDEEVAPNNLSYEKAACELLSELRESLELGELKECQR